MALKQPLTVAWISEFPIEWLSDLPQELHSLPKRHPGTWLMVLLSEFEKNPDLRVHVILLRHRLPEDFTFERNGVTFHILKCPPWLRLGTVFWADTLLIRRACKRIKPDLIHAWGMEKGAGLIGHRLGYRMVMTVQGLMGWYKERVQLHRYDRFIERIERYVFPRIRVLTTESNFSVKYLHERYSNLQIQQAEHAPNHAFHRVVRRPDTNPIHFISVGGLGSRKGTDLLFKALGELTPELSFKLTVISGPSPQYVETLRQSVSAEFWRRIEFKHDLMPDEVAQELVTPTMLLLPTRADTSPNAVKEAVAAGLPVVASDVGGIPDYVIPDKNGLLFPAGDLGQFVKAIRAACVHPLFSHGEVDAETHARMREYLSPERMAKNFLAAYELALRA